MERVMQGQMQHDVLCPVKQWVAVVCRILSYSQTDKNTEVSASWANNKLDHITADMMTNSLKAGRS